MYIGVDLGGTKIAVGLVDETAKIIESVSVATKSERPCSEIVADMVDCIEKVCTKAGISRRQLLRVGIGSPGIVDKRSGVLVYANNIRERNLPLCAELSKHMDCPVFIENDANCAALGESIAGVSSGISNSVMITLGTGIGGGIIIDGRIYSGSGGAGGEIGHMVIRHDGEQCSCGRRGCWESYASATALNRNVRRVIADFPNSLVAKLAKGDINNANCKIPFEAARQGDEIGKLIVNEYIEHVSVGIANIINIFQPEVMAIGGGIGNEGEPLIAPVRELSRKWVYSQDTPPCDIKHALLGNNAGIIGAAMLTE